MSIVDLPEWHFASKVGSEPRLRTYENLDHLDRELAKLLHLLNARKPQHAHVLKRVETIISNETVEERSEEPGQGGGRIVGLVGKHWRTYWAKSRGFTWGQFAFVHPPRLAKRLAVAFEAMVAYAVDAGGEVNPTSREQRDLANTLADALQKYLDLRRPSRRPRKTVEEVDLAARRLADRMGEAFFLLSERGQAKRIGCSWDTWSKAGFYQEAKAKRSLAQGRTKVGTQPRSPDIVSLTHVLEEAIQDGGKNDVLDDLVNRETRERLANPATSGATLEELIAEHQEDFEPSPLAEDTDQDRPRRVYRRRRRL